MRTVPLRLLMLSILIVTVSTQPVFLLGASFPQIGPEFGLSAVGLGLMTGLFFLGAAVSSPSLGRWVQRVGWRRAMRLNVSLSSGVLLTIAVAARTPWTMAPLLVVGAMTYGLANPAANLALAEHVPRERQATVFSIKHAGIPSSTLLAGLAVPLLVIRFGWRWAYVAAAGLGLLVALLIRLAPDPVARPAVRESEPVRRSLPLRFLVGMAAGSSLATWAALALGTYLVSAAVDVGFSPAAAGWLQFAGSASSIMARILAGVLTDRFHSSGFAGLVVTTGIGALVFASLPAATGGRFGTLTLLAFATGWAWPGLMTFAVVRTNPSAVAASTAIAQAGVFVGSGLGPASLGVIVAALGFDAAWWVVAVTLLGAAVVWGWVGVRVRRLEPAPQQG